MGLIESIFRPGNRISKKALKDAQGYFATLTAYQPVFRNWRGAIYESALVRAAIDARARHISKLRVETVGSAQQSLMSKLKAGPNQWQTWSQFLYRVSTILDNENTCFITPVFDEDLRITGFFPVLTDSVSIVEYKDEPWLRYRFRNGERAAVELRKVCILTKFQYRDDFFGTSNDALNETMQLITVQNQGIQEAVRNSATYRFMARLNNFSKHDDLAAERRRFSEENFSEEAKGGGLLLFPNTYTDIKQLESRNYTVDAEQMRIIQKNVYDYFGVNEDVLQNKAYGDAWSAFYEGCVEWFAVQFSEGMTRAIFTERERASGNLVIATANRLQYLSNADKLNVCAQLTDRGIFSINEAREVFNLPPVEGGDIRTIRGEYKNAEEISNGNEN